MVSFCKLDPALFLTTGCLSVAFNWLSRVLSPHWVNEACQCSPPLPGACTTTELEGAHECEDPGFCLPACLPARSLKSAGRKAGRQAGRQINCPHSLPTFLAGPFNFFSLPLVFCFKEISYVGSTYPSSLLSLSSMRGVPIEWHQYAPKGWMLLKFLKGWANWVGTNMPSRDVSCLFKGWGTFISHQVPKEFLIKFLLFQSITHQNPSSYQTIPINFLLFPTITHQIPFVPIKFPSKSFWSLKFPWTSFCSQPNPTQTHTKL
jgi:hypothetical protein